MTDQTTTALTPGLTLTVEALTREQFQPFGDVIEATSAAHNFAINSGYAQRFHDLARVDVASGSGRPLINIFRAQPRSLPFQLLLMERHPLGSQAFMPLSALPYLVVVAAPAPTLDVAQIRCFLAAPGQGVNYARGTWHHPLIALHAPCDFLVIDRGGQPGDANQGLNCDEHGLADSPVWVGVGVSAVAAP